MPSFIHLTLLLLLHICYAAALPQKRSLPPVYRPIVPRGQPFTANKRWEVIGLLLSRSTCTFLNGQTCTGQTCCVGLDESNGCCTHDCCGNGCCDPGYSCVLAEVGVTSCCPSGSSCDLPPATAYVTNTVVYTDVMVSIDTVDNTVLNTVLNTVQNTVTQTGAAVTQTQFQTVSETVSALVLTTVNSQGQTVTEVTSTTLSIQVPAAQSSNNPQPTPSPTPIGAIVGGAVGGFAALALLVFLIVLGVRRGWFSPKPHQPYAYPNGIDYSPHPGFSPEK